MTEEKKPGRPVDEEDFCGFFTRIPVSLIEEPEYCAFCEYYEENTGLCVHQDEPPPPPLQR